MKIIKNEKGFTLIELVLVIVVLAILATVAVVQFGTITTDAKHAALDGAFGPYNAQLALAVNKLKKLPHDDNDGAGSFFLEVYGNVVLAGGNVKAQPKVGNPQFCNGNLQGCDWTLWVDDNNDGLCDATEWKMDVNFLESSGAFTVSAKDNAAAC